MNLLFLSTSDLRRRWGRGILVVVLAAISVGAFIASRAINRTIDRTVRAAEMPYVNVGPAIRGETLPKKLTGLVAQLPGVAHVEFFNYIHQPVPISPNVSALVQMGSDAFPDVMPPVFFSPAAGVVEKWKADRQALIVCGSKLLQETGWREGQLVTFDVWGKPLTFKVVGAATGTAPEQLIAHYDYLNLNAPLEERDRLEGIAAHVPEGRLSDVADVIDQQTAAAGEPTFSTPVSDLFASFFASVSAIPKLLDQVSMVLVVVLMAIAAGTLYMSTIERRSEFGALRAIGFTRPGISLQILINTSALCFAGTAIAMVGLSLWFAAGGINAGKSFLQNVPITTESYLEGMALSVVLVISTSLLPIITIVRDPILTALRAND